jgi:hypothetical protein
MRGRGEGNRGSGSRKKGASAVTAVVNTLTWLVLIAGRANPRLHCKSACRAGSALDDDAAATVRRSSAIDVGVGRWPVGRSPREDEAASLSPIANSYTLTFAFCEGTCDLFGASDAARAAAGRRTAAVPVPLTVFLVRKVEEEQGQSTTQERGEQQQQGEQAQQCHGVRARASKGG